MFSRLILIFSFVLMLLPMVSWADSPSLPRSVKLAYDAYAGSFYVMSAEVEMELKDGQYSIATNSKTEGFAAWMFSWTSHVKTEGRREEAVLTPIHHRVESHWNDRNQVVQLRYEDKNPIVAQLEPPSDSARRDPVPEKLRGNTVDPLTMTANLVLGMASGGGCEGNFRVFDGRRRYDMNIFHGVTDELQEHSSALYSGEAQTCAIELKRIAGFWKKSTKAGTPLLAPTLWMASPLEGAPAVPVKFAAYSSYGSFRIHLTRFQMDDEVIELEKD